MPERDHSVMNLLREAKRALEILEDLYREYRIEEPHQDFFSEDQWHDDEDGPDEGVPGIIDQRRRLHEAIHALEHEVCPECGEECEVTCVGWFLPDDMSKFKDPNEARSGCGWKGSVMDLVRRESLREWPWPGTGEPPPDAPIVGKPQKHEWLRGRKSDET